MVFQHWLINGQWSLARSGSGERGRLTAVDL